VDRLLEDLQELGWIEITQDGDLKPTEGISKGQGALGLSLTQLAPYGRTSVVVNPIFGRPKVPRNPLGWVAH
jgi:hypothetical protein